MIAIRSLVWDDWNIAHITRHNISRNEVEEICHGSFVPLIGKKGRHVLIGKTHTDRMISVVIERKHDGVWYVVTARPTAKKERRLYVILNTNKKATTYDKSKN